jgi:mono/diheme cytochrome c family protein
MRVILPALICAAVLLPMANAAAPDPVSGRKYAQIQCGGCHVIAEKKGKAPPSPVEGAAPRFAVMARDPIMTPEKIRETLKLPHGSMANLVVSEKDTENIISYIASLR